MKRTLPPLLLLALAIAAPARAVEVSYQAADVADLVAGEDRWVYRYRLDDFPFDAGYGFTVYFDPDLYADLDPSPVAPNASWDPLTIEPDANLGDDGLYDAEALVDLAPVNGVFAVAFRWLGSGPPGAQPFEVREPGPSYAPVPGQTGTTVLPEPARLALGAGAILALAATRRSFA